MHVTDTLAALGLEDEATVSPRTGGDGGGNSFAVPIEWSRSYIGDFTLTRGDSGCLWHPGELLGLCPQGRGHVSVSDRGTGTSGGHFSAPTSWAEGPRGSYAG